MNYCNNCGRKLNEGVRFCPECGKNLMPRVTEQEKSINEIPIKKEKKKSRKLLIILILFFGVLFSASIIFILMKFVNSGDKSLGKSEFKDADTNLLIKTKEYGKIPSNQILVILNDDEGDSKAKKIGEIAGGKVTGNIEFLNLYQIEIKSSTFEELKEKIKKIQKEDGVYAAFPNAELVLRQTAAACDPLDDPVYDKSNYKEGIGSPIEHIGLKEAWKIIKASGVKFNNVQVGVIDEQIGIKSDRKIKNNKNISVLRGEDTLRRGQSHGNMVIDIIGGDMTNGGGSGVASILKENLKITATSPMKNGTICYTDAIDRMKAQVESGAKVINCSIGYLYAYENQDKERDDVKGVKLFLEKLNKEHPDVIIVAAAPNDKNALNGKNDWWGHKLPNLVTVSGVSGDGQMIGSHQGEGGEITICGISGYTYGNADDQGYGTSSCTPQITATIALMKSINPKLTNEEIKDILRSTSSKSVNGNNMPPNSGSGLVRIDDAVLKVINDLRKKENKPELKKEDLLQLANLEVSSSGGPKEFTITAEIKSVSEKGTSLTIEYSGDNCSGKGEKEKNLNSPGKVSWSITLKDESKPVTIKIKRLDFDVCKSIEVGGKIKAEDLVGEWNGGVCHDDWSTPYKIAEPKIREKLVSVKGEFLQMKMTMTLSSENILNTNMNVSSSKMPPPPLDFSFDDGNLSASTLYMMNNYRFSGKVVLVNGVYNIEGTWSAVATNGSMKMNGRWKANKSKK